MGYPKIELPRNGQYIHLNEPKIFHDEITQTYKCVNKISVQINQMAETHIVQAIIDYAKEQGITDLFLIDEDFVKSALLNEKARRERQAIKPKANFDRITEDVEAFADWIFKSYTNVPENVPCPVENCETRDRMDCKKCFKEWLQKEADDGI